jgi:hypothetical protein
MPDKLDTTHQIIPQQLIVYRRPNSSAWQCRYKVDGYIARHEPEILSHLELVVNTVSMEEAVQQQLNAELDDLPPG